MALLDQGVPTDDISLVARGNKATFGKTVVSQPHLADASSFVGASDDPIVDDPTPNPPDSEAKYEGVESEIGPGISSSNPDDFASTVDEADESQWLSSDNQEPGETTTQADRELRDLDLAVNLGYPSKPTALADFEPSSVPAIDDLERSLEIIDVPNFGVVMGGGSLATAALDYAGGDAAGNAWEMKNHFEDEGVPDEMAATYLQALDMGQAVLAVGLVPGEVEAPLVETVADQFGAADANTFDAPRY